MLLNYSSLRIKNDVLNVVTVFANYAYDNPVEGDLQLLVLFLCSLLFVLAEENPKKVISAYFDE